jgi:hypothetical protein
MIVRVKGRVFEVYLDNELNVCTNIPVEGANADVIRAKDASELKKILTKRLTAKGIAIPAVRFYEKGDGSTKSIDPKVVPVTITGIHGSNRRVLYREGNIPRQYSYGERLMIQLTPAQEKKLIELTKAFYAAKDAYNQYRDSLELDSRELEELVGLVSRGSTARKAINMILERKEKYAVGS